ncbi:cell division control protein 42 homolog isoform X1 [Harmonia axyridis]|uniref:cell division control protein 42 homolog isoform X1 n=1 Tax=Harmonia axyridis TaxID=115357 RepID=UPI001E277269|nr:cell division control protein 42 homolog isoform X1 [Harmonia axyridis]
MTDDPEVIRCVAIGDGYVGKTSLLSRLSGKKMNEYYASTIFENSKVSLYHKNKKYDLLLIDTAGQEEYNILRTQAYSYGDIFLLCYSVDNMDSFINIREMWLPEVKKCKENAKFLLIGLKNDLRTDLETIDRLNITKKIFVSQEDAENMAMKLGMPHIECSSKKQESFDKMIEEIIELGKMKVPEFYSCMDWLKNVLCFGD